MNTKRPRTVVVSIRCDLRDLAVCALWLNEQGHLPESMGALGRKTIELFSDMIRSKNDLYAKMTTAEALSTINQMGLRKGQRNQESLIKRLELEDAALELQSSSRVVMPHEDISGIAEDVAKSRSSGAYSKEQMDRITNQLGGTVDEPEPGSTDETDSTS